MSEISTSETSEERYEKNFQLILRGLDSYRSKFKIISYRDLFHGHIKVLRHVTNLELYVMLEVCPEAIPQIIKRLKRELEFWITKT